MTSDLPQDQFVCKSVRGEGCSAGAGAARQVLVATVQPTETLMELIDVIRPFGPGHGLRGGTCTNDAVAFLHRRRAIITLFAI